DLLAPEATVRRVVSEVYETLNNFNVCKDTFEGQNGNTLTNRSANLIDIEKVAAMSSDIIGHHTSLIEWCGWVRRRSEALDHQFAPLVDAIENGSVDFEEIIEVFEAAYCAWWSSAVIGEDEVLRTFSSPEHEADIMTFQKLDTEFCALTAR